MSIGKVWCDKHDAQPGLRLLVALGKRGNQRHQRGAQQHEGQQQQERTDNDGWPEVWCHTQLLKRHEFQHNIERQSDLAVAMRP